MKPWEQVMQAILELLAERVISPEQAESWLWSIVEYAEKAA